MGIFHHQGRVLSEHGKPSCKVVVVGNPANTNAAILSASAPNLDPRNITCLTRLDHNRAQSLVARRVGCAADEVEGIVTWGNHSATQYPDLRHASVRGEAVVDLIGDAWVEDEFIKVIQQRGAAIIKARNRSSAASAAKAVVDHLRDWVCGTHNGTVSMGVVSDGGYGVPAGLFYSLPVTCANGAWTVRTGLHIDAFSARMMKVTADELEGELAMARAYLATASCEK